MSPSGQNKSIDGFRVMRTECGIGTGETIHHTQDGRCWTSPVSSEDRNRTGVIVRCVVNK